MTMVEAATDCPPLVVTLSVTLGIAVGVTEGIGVIITVGLGVGVRVLSFSISLAGTPILSTGF
ncbi:MAG: hypothetical protein UV28_C0003G0032 [Candidatus Collierbacteria bacterium GW2011_GWE2_42_48]|nr:MAG: hypothetical protein UV28_C0003G0032 [Candidatus Collierbacteria bacterium GW2011_GWE2_42_48]KKS63480.1 MAG: hypothetical protein UV29_C0001G0037 [Candidatus Collierbacteria bacterium GW2011_GWD2_42_50]KKS64557.1 MAG: hypothetical protein UV32_C0012G0041 [Candidatus Collierbacteria bacterium GW2011_GWF2_42_51]